MVAVFLDGFLRSYSYSDPLTPSLSISNDIQFAVLYVLALLGILGIHEMGHKISSRVHKMNSSWPYFIPGIPGIWPTFGAVIRAADAPPNRDALFDLGLSGPVAGLRDHSCGFNICSDVSAHYSDFVLCCRNDIYFS